MSIFPDHLPLLIETAYASVLLKDKTLHEHLFNNSYAMSFTVSATISTPVFSNDEIYCNRG